MAQWTSREHEIAIRASLGGARGRIVRSLLTESTLDRHRRRRAGRRAHVCVARPRRAQRADRGDVRHVDRLDDYRVQSGLVTLAAGLLTGVAPAFYETRRLHVNPLNAIRGSDRVRQRWRHALVVFEIADHGGVAGVHRRDAVVVCEEPQRQPGLRYASDPQRARRPIRRVSNPGLILDRLRSLPGVASAEVAHHGAVPGDWAAAPSSSADPATTAPVLVRGGAIGPQYFSTLACRCAPAGCSPTPTPPAANPSRSSMTCSRASCGRRRTALRDRALGRQVCIEGRPHLVVGVVTGYSMTAIQPPRPAAFTAIRAAATAADTSGIHDSRRRRCGAVHANGPARNHRDGRGSTVAGVTTIEQIKQSSARRSSSARSRCFR